MLYCNKCKADVNCKLTQRTFKDNTRHTQANCETCGGFIRFVRKVDEDVDMSEDNMFVTGKHKGKSFEYVCTHNPEYFMWLAGQPLSSIWNYLDFIHFCLERIAKGTSRPL